MIDSRRARKDERRLQIVVAGLIIVAAVAGMATPAFAKRHPPKPTLLWKAYPLNVLATRTPTPTPSQGPTSSSLVSNDGAAASPSAPTADQRVNASSKILNPQRGRYHGIVFIELSVVVLAVVGGLIVLRRRRDRDAQEEDQGGRFLMPRDRPQGEGSQVEEDFFSNREQVSVTSERYALVPAIPEADVAAPSAGKDENVPAGDRDQLTDSVADGGLDAPPTAATPIEDTPSPAAESSGVDTTAALAPEGDATETTTSPASEEEQKPSLVPESTPVDGERVRVRLRDGRLLEGKRRIAAGINQRLFILDIEKAFDADGNEAPSARVDSFLLRSEITSIEQIDRNN